MNFMVRPSKSFLFDLLESELFNLSGEIGLDAACDNMKNRRMFKTKKYIGLDINLESLTKAAAKLSADGVVYPVHADMSDLEGLAKDSCDVVVSTNTIYQIPNNLQSKSIENLCELVNGTGTLICELSLNDQFDLLLKIISEYFAEVKVYYYKNYFSQMYEKFFERDGYLGSHPIASKKIFRLLSWLISRLEFLTFKNRQNKKHALIIAKGKRNQSSNEFDLSKLPVIDGGVYSLFEYRRGL